MKSPLLAVTLLLFWLGAALATTTEGHSTYTSPFPVAGNTSMTTGNASSTTAAGPVKASLIIPSFRVNNSNGEAAMLLVFNATLKVRFNTRDRGPQETTMLISNASYYDSSIEGGSPANRIISLWYPGFDFCAQLTLDFRTKQDPVMGARYGFGVLVTLRYNEPCFPSDVVPYAELFHYGITDLNYKGTVGKSLRCNIMTHSQPVFDLTMGGILFQPYADLSSDKGHFGEEETCADTVLPTKNPRTTASPPPTGPPPTGPFTTPSKPNQINAAMIAGIVIGVVAVVAVIVVGVAVYKMRKRKVSYGQFNNEAV